VVIFFSWAKILLTPSSSFICLRTFRINEPEPQAKENPAKKMRFDAIVANPPFSLRWNPTEELAKDFRFANYGLAPKSAADFAFLLQGYKW
jgi:type I restriction-modification system DNA methylase subunit